MKKQANQREYFAVTAPGLAQFCAAELAQHGLLVGKASDAITPGGVSFLGDRSVLYRANLHLRTASRILVRLGEFHAENFDQLRSRAALLNWA